MGEQKPPAAVRFNPRLVRVESHADARRILRELDSDPSGVTIMSRKMVHLVISVENVQARAANITKQIMLSKGGECATPHDMLLADGKETFTIVLMGTVIQMRRAIRNLAAQPFGLKGLSVELKALLDRVSGKAREPLVAGSFRLPLGERTLVMGVVNVTPDSFSEAGEHYGFDAARARALEMAEAGADIIDIGGESSRPGAEPVSLDEELRRTVPLIESLAGELPVPISIDTCKSEVAARALDAGASVLNDISGLRFDPGLVRLAAMREVPVIIMHMQGEPRNMQENPTYGDVIADITRFLRERAAFAIDNGVAPNRILVDPGIGFGKKLEHNLEILRRLDEFASLPFPLVLGTSRKRFIGAVLDRPTDERLWGTAATVAFAISRGVDVVRVHDVEEMVEVARMADALALGRCDNPADRLP